jgi:Fur family ferric uptake transcriptional regulator
MDKSQGFEQMLRKAGLKAGSAKVALLKALSRHEKPLTVAEVLRASGGKMNESTAYRGLEALAEAGLASRVDLHHGHAHYELERTHHHHLVCEGCGALEDVEACAAEPMERAALRGSTKFARITSHDLAFFGLCRTCA